MLQRIRILFICSTLDAKTGAGRLNSEIIQALEDNFNIEKVTVTEKSGSGNFEILPGNRKSPVQLYRMVAAIKKLSKECDIVHALDGWPYGFYGALTGKPLIITALGTYAASPLDMFPTNILVKYSYKKARALACLSRYTASRIIAKIPEIKDKIFIINPGVNLDKFAGSAVKKENYILSVGAAKKRKGYHISIPAFALAKQKFPDLKYKIVCGSDNNWLQKLRLTAKEHGVKDEVEFIRGITDDELVTLYRKAKLFILTSVNEGYNFEGFGLVFLEAATAGLPVVGTKNNGIEDAVRDGYNGILVKQDNIQETADAIVKILSDPAAYDVMARNSIFWAEQHTWRKATEQYIKIYEKAQKNN